MYGRGCNRCKTSNLRVVDHPGLRQFLYFLTRNTLVGTFSLLNCDKVWAATILRISDLSFQRWLPNSPPTNAYSPSNCSFCTSSTTPTTICSAEPLGHTPIYNLNTCTCAPQTPTTTSASSMSSLSRSPPAHLDKSSRPRSTRASA